MCGKVVLSEGYPHNMNNTNTLQLVILGETDAIWFPDRTLESPKALNIQQLRRDYAAHGVRFRPDAFNVSRQKAFRALDEAVHAGLVTTSKNDKSKWVFAKLTDAGERSARAMACLPWLDVVKPLVVKLAGETNRADEDSLTHGWIPEAALCPGDRDGKPTATGGALSRELARLEMVLMPAFNRGYVEARADQKRHVYYRVTKAGRAFAVANLGNAGKPDPEPSDDDDAEVFVGAYIDARDDAYQRLDAPLNRNLREIGELPLPVSMPWCRGHARPVAEPKTKSRTRRNASRAAD